MTDMNLKYSSVFDGLEGISHGFFGRKGGVSKGKYNSLNVGAGSDDNPVDVTENRRRVAERIGTKEPLLLSAHQCHSTHVVIATGPFPDGRPKVDAIVTNTPGVAVSALAADCAPVLFADPVNKVVGAAHAGWRGAVAGITDQTIIAMESIGADRSQIVAAVGPCIGPQNFEVGPEFVSQFLEENSDTADLFAKGSTDRSYFDMKTYLVRRLKGFGLPTVEALPECTYAFPDQYFSYRHNCHKGIDDYGRNISAIMLNNDNV